ncbi:hypothetical protein CPB84DRAFT_1796614 [Gymnopilus junonius]|uniref:MARVEL domain-containing protein n=1 Tax=Gymnopilus junonius TaxID=109634 RepID=A0A9P5NB87_GYMJU|nr:hypothetical protein CPB84DRAFT_1796614 [Gymnopilus junonius]
MVSFTLVRAAVFVTVTVFAVLELALGAAITNWTTTKLNGFFSFAALAIATAILTICTLPVMLFLSFRRTGAIPSMVASEFGWTWILWILWLAVGGSAANISGTRIVMALIDSVHNQLGTLCREVQALEAFGFLAWIVLFAYNIILTYIIVTQTTRGNANIWTIYIMQVEFDTPAQVAPQPSMGDVENKADANFAPQYPPTPNPIASPSPASTPNPNYASVNQPMMSTPTSATTSPYPQV